MVFLFRTKQCLLLVSIALIFTTLWSCARTDALEKIDFEFTGRVLDRETKVPIEGAYVIAIYKSVVAGPAAVSSHCVKTKGMYTGKDGKFHFPVEKRDGYSPWTVEALHLNYEYASSGVKPDHIHRAQQAEAYADRDVRLKKLDATNLSPTNLRLGGSGEAYCLHAKNKDDVTASVEQFKLERAQYVKFNRGQDSLDNLDRMIRRLETLDGRPPDAIAEPARPLKK